MTRSVQLQMIDDFQCPGCIHGTDPETCSQYKLVNDTTLEGCFYCKNWRPSTFMGGVGRFCLGLPKGFSRTGMIEFGKDFFCYMRLYQKAEDMPGYDKFNVPVWAMEKEGYLFVRCYSPRSNWLFVDVVKDGKLTHAPGAINVSEFYEEMD